MARASECSPTTSWTLGVAAGDGASRESLAWLSMACWAPMYAYAGRTGRLAEEFRDPAALKHTFSPNDTPLPALCGQNGDLSNVRFFGHSRCTAPA